MDVMVDRGSMLNIFDKTINYKGTLLETCIQLKLNIEYETTSHGDAHKLRWKSQGILVKDNKKILSLSSTVFMDKKVAIEQYISFIIHDYINDIINNETKVDRKEKSKDDIPESSSHNHSDRSSKNSYSRINYSVKQPKGCYSDISYSCKPLGPYAIFMPPKDNPKSKSPEKSKSMKINHTFDLKFLSSNFPDQIGQIYLIDLENCPQMNLSGMKLNNNTDVTFIGFSTRMNFDPNKYKEWTIIDTDTKKVDINQMFIYTIDGGYKDLVDHFMSMFVYPLSVWIKDHSFTGKVTIITKDHAGWCTKTLLDNLIKIMDLDVTTSIDKIIN